MIILPNVKLGTMPFGCSVVKSKRKMPIVGDIIFIRSHNGDTNIHSNPWKQVKVDKVNEACYFVTGY